MKLVDLMKRANAGYPDGYMDQYFSDVDGVPHRNPDCGDTLAEFVVRELADTFEPNASDEDQIDRAVEVMERAASDLAGVMAALRGQPREE